MEWVFEKSPKSLKPVRPVRFVGSAALAGFLRLAGFAGEGKNPTIAQNLRYTTVAVVDCVGGLGERTFKSFKVVRSVGWRFFAETTRVEWVFEKSPKSLKPVRPVRFVGSAALAGFLRLAGFAENAGNLENGENERIL